MKTRHFLYGLLLAGGIFFASCDDDDSIDRKSLSAQDKDFVEKAALANRAEIELGGLAATNGTDSLVKAYGARMVAEHEDALDELEDIEDDYDNVDWPTELDDEHKQLRDQLTTLSGYSFDSLYINSQVTDHQRAIELFQTEISAGVEAKVKAYATKYLPHIQEHHEQADSIRNAIVTVNDQ